MRYDDVILRWAKIATVLFTAMAVVADVFGVVITKYIAYCWAGVFDLPSVIGLTTVFLYRYGRRISRPYSSLPYVIQYEQGQSF